MILEIFQTLTSCPNYLFENKTAKKWLLKLFKPGIVPGHIGLIMDGNRRFAKEKGLPTKEGHIAGANALANALESCFEIGIKEVSIYAFSIENFNRPKQEVDDLLTLLRDRLKDITKKEWAELKKAQIRIVGNRSLIDPGILEDLEKVEQSSVGQTPKISINVCFAYTARDEITHSIREVTSKRNSHSLTKTDIDERVLSENFYTRNSSRPLDILIRTSGHTRMSDFLLWQCASNCKIVFLDTLWPHFTFWELYVTLLKWSFEQTLAYNRHFYWKVFDTPTYVPILLLPQSPPFASVAQSTKAVTTN